MEHWTRGTLNGYYGNYWYRSPLVSRILVMDFNLEIFSIYSWSPPSGCSQVRKENKIKRLTKMVTLDCTSIPGAGLLSSTLQSTSSWFLLSWFAKFCMNCQLRSSAGWTGIAGWYQMLRSPTISGDRDREEPRRPTDRAAWEEFLTFQSLEYWWLLYWDCGLQVIFNKTNNSVLSPE